VRFPLSNHHFKQHKYLVSRLRKFRGVGNQVDKNLLDSLDVYPPKFITSKFSKLDVKIFCQDLS
jgi:hemerythrin